MYGGVGLYLSNAITNVNILKNTCICKSCHCSKCNFESIFISFTFQRSEFILGGIYRHPNGNMKHFVEDLERTLMNINGNASCILAGDLNIDIIKFENEGTMNYLTTLFSYRFLPYITLPSRITSLSATCIDHIFVRIADKKRLASDDIASGLFFNDITDHLPCFISIKCGNYITKNNRPLTRVFGDKNCKRFIESMQAENWPALYSLDVDWYSNFISVIKHKFETCFPLVRVSRKRLKDRPWITAGLKSSIKKSHHLYRNTLYGNCPQMINKYKKYKVILRNCLKVAKQNYYCHLFDDTKQSAYNLWKNLGPVINPNKKKRQTTINKMCFEGKYITIDQDIANHMNSYFCEIGEKLQGVIPNSGYDYNRYLPIRVENTFFLSPTNINEILNEIKKLNQRKSCGPDGIGAKVIKLCPMIVAENLCLIYNKAIEIGKYPMALKVAKVIALFKKGDKNQPNNYRPISLLSCFNKIFEKLLCKRLVKFLEVNRILFEYQYGFRKLYSTTLALIEFTDNIIKFLDEGQYCMSIFVDLTKAFDTMDHEILLDKLDRYGIQGHANRFFRSYLSDRHQYTLINGVNSTLKNTTCGVPQGSVLGPLFFAIYINDIYNAVGQNDVRLFADDTALFMHHPDLNILTFDIINKFNELNRLCISNKLTINADKTNFILFHTINKPIPNDFSEITIEFMTIKRVNSFKYLGITLDETLNWSEHVSILCESLLKYFGIFNHIKYRVTPKMARQIYYAFIYSRIQYGIEVYSSCSETHINRLQVIQYKLLKLILKLDRLTATNILHKEINLLKVTHIGESSVLGFVNKVLCGHCPEIFLSYYKIKRNAYDVRTKGQLVMPQTRIQFGDRAVKVKGCLLWNRISKNMLKHRFSKSFKDNLVKYYISTY